jgi:metal-responsive CopG/Arc/MetJ family transcriptional regulator
MKKSRRARQEFTTISLPTVLFKKVEKRIEGTGFPSVSGYVAFLLRVLISEGGKDSKANYEAEIIKEKLRDLGYL